MLLRLDYTSKHHFNNGYLVIRYRFRNVLWYKFKNIKVTTEKEMLILNLKNVAELPIELTVYGFFRTKTLSISVEPEKILQNKLFKTKLTRLNKINLNTRSIKLKEIKPVPSIQKIQINDQNVQMKHSSYFQTDFI